MTNLIIKNYMHVTNKQSYEMHMLQQQMARSAWTHLLCKVIMVMLAAGSPVPHLLFRNEVYEPAVPLCPGTSMQLQGC